MSFYGDTIDEFIQQFDSRLAVYELKYGFYCKQNFTNILIDNLSNQGYVIALLLSLEDCNYGMQMNPRKLICEKLENINFQNVNGTDASTYTAFLVGILLISLCFVLMFAICIARSIDIQNIKPDKKII